MCSQIKDSTSVLSLTDLKTIQVKRPQQAWNQNLQQNVTFSYKTSGFLFFYFLFHLDKTLGSKSCNYSHISQNTIYPSQIFCTMSIIFLLFQLLHIPPIYVHDRGGTATKDQQAHRSVWTVEKSGRKGTEFGFLEADRIQTQRICGGSRLERWPGVLGRGFMAAGNQRAMKCREIRLELWNKQQG